jgi:hypothetical protein
MLWINYCTLHCCKSKNHHRAPQTHSLDIVPVEAEMGNWAGVVCFLQPQATATAALMISRPSHDKLTYPPSLTTFMRLLPCIALLFPSFSLSAAYSPVPRSVPHFLALYGLLIVNSSGGDKQSLSSTMPFSCSAVKQTRTTRMGTLPLLGTTISSSSPSPPHSIPLLHHGSISRVLRTPPFHPKEAPLPGIPSPHSTPPPCSFSVATRAPFPASSCSTTATPLNCSTYATAPHQLFSRFPTTGQVNPNGACVTPRPRQMGKSTSSVVRLQTARETRSPPTTSSTPPSPRSPNSLPKIHLPASTVTRSPSFSMVGFSFSAASQEVNSSPSALSGSLTRQSPT